MRTSTAVLLSGLAAAQAFCPAPATSGVLSLRAQSEGVSRRNVIAGLIGGASLAAVNIIVPANANADTSPYTGEYDDPNHPGCVRSVKVIAQKSSKRKNKPAVVSKGRFPNLQPEVRFPQTEQVVIRGTDGPGGSCANGDAAVKPWSLTGYVNDSGNLFMDFTPKGGPKDLVATYDGGIKWPDGNTWTRKVEAK
mmetsp:Transcript_35360/g.84076  ORF Transcript_35360/g.84076 Transcript_35360/m.84076 type:complete len:194 (-) Transcript_35360:62-643(-)